MENTNIQTNMFDKIEHHYNCAVEILTNSVTGEQSIGWVSMDSPIVERWQEDDKYFGLNS